MSLKSAAPVLRTTNIVMLMSSPLFVKLANRTGVRHLEWILAPGPAAGNAGAEARCSHRRSWLGGYSERIG